MKQEKIRFTNNSITNLIFAVFFAYSPAAFFALLASALYNYITSTATANLVSAASLTIYIFLIIFGYAFIKAQKGEKIKEIHYKIAAIIGSVLVAGAGYWICTISNVKVTGIAVILTFLTIPGITGFCIFND